MSVKAKRYGKILIVALTVLAAATAVALMVTWTTAQSGSPPQGAAEPNGVAPAATTSTPIPFLSAAPVASKGQ